MIMRKLFIALTLPVVIFLNLKTTKAQEVDYYQQQFTNIFSELDTTGLETGLLADAAFPFRNLRLFNGSEKPLAILTLQEYELVTIQTME